VATKLLYDQTDRFSLVIDAIDRMPRFREIGATARETLRNRQFACQEYACVNGIDRSEEAA
jgi:xylulose-5-phosphate/fructose-6-phosphate phosphoketolase